VGLLIGLPSLDGAQISLRFHVDGLADPQIGGLAVGRLAAMYALVLANVRCSSHSMTLDRKYRTGA
jgi:hypothetical protein